MALNTIILPYNKILEVEECEPVSSPSSTSFEEHKSVPYINSLYSPIHKTYDFSLELNEKKNKSSPTSLDSHDFHEIFFGENNNENNNSTYSQKEVIKFNDTEQENFNINRYIDDNKDNINLERAPFEIKKLYSTRANNNPFQKTENFESIDESYNNERITFNSIRRKQRETDNMDRNKFNRIYDSYMNNPKINPVKEDKRIDSLIDDISHLDNKILSINTEEKNSLFNTKEIPKIRPKISEVNKISLSPSLKFRNSNPNPMIKNGIYFKKRIVDSNTTFGKKRQNDINSSNDVSSLNRDSIKTDKYKEIKAKNRPLTLNINLKKKKMPSLKISQFQKILRNDGLFHLFKFFDYYDFINLFKTKNKQLYILINTALANAYYFNIKEALMKYNNVIELLKCTIVHSKIKDALKIDFVINIRFINNTNKNPNRNYKIKLGGPKNGDFIEPLYFQFGYIYNYIPKVKNKKELITKEDYEKQVKRLKMYDYYTFDLYPENNTKNNMIKNNSIFISKELSLFEKDGNNNIVNIQPILPFCINDKGIINLELYTTNNGFIDPDSIKIIVKSSELKNYIKMLAEKNVNNPRICECEDLCLHWKNINLYPNHKTLVFRLKKLFEPFFTIDKIYFGNIGVNIFKVYLKAIKSGEIKDKNKFKIKIRIKENNDYIENEIRKNNLLFERRDIFELKVGDEILYYFPMK